MVIGRPRDENFRFIPEDLHIEHRDYYNDVLIEIEYDIVKCMHYYSGLLLTRRFQENNRCIFLDSPYREKIKSLKISGLDSDKYCRYKINFLDKMIFNPNSSDVVTGRCNEIWNKCKSPEVAANNAFFISLVSMWDYAADKNIERYVTKAPIYKCLSISWIHKAINALKTKIDLEEQMYGNGLISNEKNLPDLLKHDKLIREVDWLIYQPLARIDPNYDDFIQTF